MGYVTNAVTLSEQEDCNKIRQHVAQVNFSTFSDQLVELFCEHRKSVTLPHEKLGCNDIVEHVINLEPHLKPMYIPVYRMSHSRRQVADKLVQKILDSNVIEPIISPWNAPLLTVPKLDGKFRPVTDYRRQ